MHPDLSKYEAPAIEREVSDTDLVRESLYAGVPLSNPPR